MQGPVPATELLSTGSTVLNLACSGYTKGGFRKGCYYLFVGDSVSGKTFVTLTCLAEAAINPNFDDYRFIYDGPEHGALMDWTKYFGKGMAERTEPPAMKDGEPYHSSIVEEFYYHIDDAYQRGRPFIYILDSMDAISSKDDIAKFEERKNAYRKQKEVSGTYGTAKAKINSENLRQVVSKLERSGSILIIISQTRDNLGFGFEKKTRGGGRSLRFYATIEMWSSVVRKITRPYKGKKYGVGNMCEVKVKKNRVNGRERSVTIPIYYQMGIDDIGSCVDYLVENDHWKKRTGGVIVADDLVGRALRREKLIEEIEADEALVKKLRMLVGKTWREIEKAIEVPRKRPYT